MFFIKFGTCRESGSSIRHDSTHITWIWSSFMKNSTCTISTDDYLLRWRMNTLSTADWRRNYNLRCSLLSRYITTSYSRAYRWYDWEIQDATDAAYVLSCMYKCTYICHLNDDPGPLRELIVGYVKHYWYQAVCEFLSIYQTTKGTERPSYIIGI